MIDSNCLVYLVDQLVHSALIMMKVIHIFSLTALSHTEFGLQCKVNAMFNGIMCLGLKLLRLSIVRVKGCL